MSTSSDLSPLELANRTSVSSLRVKRITVHVRNKKLQKYGQKEIETNKTMIGN